MYPDTSALRARLAALRAAGVDLRMETETRSLADIRGDCELLGSDLYQIRTLAPEKRGDTWLIDIRTKTALLHAADAEFTMAIHAHDQRAAAAAEGRGPGAATGDTSGGIERRTAGTQFIANAEFAEWAKRAGGKGTSPGLEVERRTLLTTGTSSNDAGALLAQGQPFIAPGAIDRRRLFIRDLIAPGSTTLNSVPYVREYLPRTNENSATGVAEGAAKPEAVMQFESADAPVRKIAAWIPITTEALEDMPTLASYIDGRLAYMVMISEEAGMLNGAGPNNILGILQTANIQAQTFSTDKPITIGRAIGKIELVDGEADGLTINPTDFWAMVTTRTANQFDGAANVAESGAPFGPPLMTVWGLPAVRTRVQPAGSATVGAWRLGAQVFDRKTVEIRVTDSHSDYFIYNKMVVLAESRLALAVHRPDFFCTAAFS